MREGEKKAQEKARELRGKMPNAEVILWSRLRRNALGGLRFRRQHPIGPYIADFAAPLARLVIELDGGSHATDEAHKFDQVRDRYMRSRGWQVLRFRNDEVYQSLMFSLSFRRTFPLRRAEGARLLPRKRGRKGRA
ncbi:MAG: endonuclease domain-containing protein [Rhizomicrobium sp.]